MEYKIGDKVRIVKRTNEYDYPFGFTEEMASLAGQVFTIKQIFQTSVHECSINGDYHRYILTDRDQWNWHSSMFEPVESSSELKVGDTVRVISKGFEEGHPLLFPEMKHFLGGIFKITHVNYHSDGNHAYYLDGDAKGWFWPISALEKMEFVDEIKIDKDTEDFLREASSDDSELIEISDCEISASIYTDAIKIIL